MKPTFRPMHKMHAEIGRLLSKGREGAALELYERMPTRYRFVHVLMLFHRRLSTPSARRSNAKDQG